MDNSDHSARKIIAGFETIEFKAPKGVWSEIIDNLEDGFDVIDEKVKDCFENTNKPAPKGIWEGIDKQLTIDKGWVKVYKYLQLQTFYKWTRRAAALLLLVVIVFIGLNNSFNKNHYTKLSHNDQEFEKNAQQNGAVKNNSTNAKSTEDYEKHYPFGKDTSTTNFTAQSNLIIQSSDKEYSTSISSNPDANLFNSLLNMEKNEITLLNADQNMIDFQLNQNKENQGGSLDVNSKHRIDGISLTENITPPPSAIDSISNSKNNSDSLIHRSSSIASTDHSISQTNNSENKEIKINKDLKETKFELGVTTAINSTAIINNATINSYRETSLVDFIPAFGSNIGLQFVYHIREKHSLVSNLTNSSVKQAYNTFSKGRFNNEEINLNFIRIQSLYQYSYKRLENQKTALSIKAGPFFGFVTKSERTINDIPESVNYNNFDIGITLQIGQSIALRKFVLDYGLNIDRGLTNMNKEIYGVTASFDKTTHFGTGAYFSLRYKF
jgi:hypothetical protein